MKKALVILNLFAAVLLIPGMALVHVAQVRSGMNMYVELDRAQVVDRRQLERMFPEESKNDRRDIPRRFMGQRKSAWIVGYPCMLGFILNAVLVGVFMERRSKPSSNSNIGSSTL